MANLVAACIDCNEDKSDLTAVSYRRLTRSIRHKRKNDLIMNDFNRLAVPFAGLTSLGLWDVVAWWNKRDRQKKQGNHQPLTFESLPWLGIICIVLVLVLLFVIIKSHKTT